MSQSRRLPDWPPLAQCIEEVEFGIYSHCPQTAGFDRGDQRCYAHGKVADGKFENWRPRLAAPKRLHEIRPADFERRQRYDYEAWFDGEVHELIPGQDFVPNICSMVTAIRGVALRRGVKVDVHQRNGRLHVQALGQRDQPATGAA